MDATDSEMMSQGEGEVESPLQPSQQQSKLNAVPSLGRQLSIYSLTLDEFQHTLCEVGKNFGSMNMDEFLNSIWTAEENQAQAQGHAQVNAADTGNVALQFPIQDSNAMNKGISKLPRQGSFSVPEPLSSKTVDQVWSEIHKSTQQPSSDGNGHVQNTNAAQRQETFGEMTLEDFLVRAGVVRAPDSAPAPVPQQSPYGMYQNSSHPPMGPNFVARPIMAIAGGGGGAAAAVAGGVSVAATYQAVPQSGAGEAPGYPGGMKMGGAGAGAGAYSQQPSAVSFGGKTGNVAGGFGQVQGLGVVPPASPVSSDGLCTNQADSGNQYGLDMGGARGGRKRATDGPVERVVERRQRRMIKNRESAARSRARKQAYTVELEAELNQLKEENAHLKQALAEIERERKQQYYEKVRAKAQVQSKAQRANEKLRVMRRTSSCIY